MEKEVFTRKFIIDLTERAIATFAEALLGFLLVVAAAEGGVNDVAWSVAIPAAVLAALISVLKSLVAVTRGKRDSASLAKEV